MSGPELEPCPFCGGEMQLWEFGTQVRHAHDADGCPIRHLTLFRNCWNRRAPLDYAELPEVQAMIAEAVAKERGDLEHPITAYTFAVQHNPNCPSPWLVRMPGKSGMIDMKPYRGFHLTKEDMTGDLLAFGRTFKDAADAAIRKRRGE